jgi:hypothetical protein
MNLHSKLPIDAHEHRYWQDSFVHNLSPYTCAATPPNALGVQFADAERHVAKLIAASLDEVNDQPVNWIVFVVALTPGCPSRLLGIRPTQRPTAQGGVCNC